MILIRYVLVSLIIFLLVRSFIRLGEESKTSEQTSERVKKNSEGKKRISKRVGEYIDYEDVKK
jgi:large-conductance mechanosensitive channel